MSNFIKTFLEISVKHKSRQNSVCGENFDDGNSGKDITARLSA